MSEWIPDLGNDEMPVAPEVVADQWDATWPYNFKWGMSAEGEVTVWRVQGGKDGRPGHRAELEAVWGRSPRVADGDLLGLATYIPAEVKIDGTVVAPAEVRVQTYYGAMMPQELVRWFNQHFPDANVREAAVIANQLPMKKFAHLTKFTESENWDAWNPIVETDEEEETYKWVWNEKEGVIIFGREEAGGQYPWKTHAEMVEETWARPLNGSDHLGYAVRVGVDGANQIEMEVYGTCPPKGVQAVKGELVKMFPDFQIILPSRYENDSVGPSSNLDYLASAKWAWENLSDVPAKAPESDSNGILGKVGVTVSSMYRRALERLRIGSKGPDLEGVMICLFVPEEIGKKLAQDDGEKVEDMHVTLAYFVDKFAERDDWHQVEEVIKRISEKYPPFEGSLNGFGVFFNDDGQVLWAAPNIKGINEFQHELVEAVEEAGFPVSQEYEFTPHITLKYEFDGDYSNLEEIGQLDITFDKIAVAQGLDRKEFDLTGEGFLKETGWLEPTNLR